MDAVGVLPLADGAGVGTPLDVPGGGGAADTAPFVPPPGTGDGVPAVGLFEAGAVADGREGGPLAVVLPWVVSGVGASSGVGVATTSVGKLSAGADSTGRLGAALAGEAPPASACPAMAATATNGTALRSINDLRICPPENARHLRALGPEPSER
jgi:hypothetical protein